MNGSTSFGWRLWHVCIFVFAASGVCGPLAASVTETGFVERVYRDALGEHKYVVFVPYSYTPDKRWPVSGWVIRC